MMRVPSWPWTLGERSEALSSALAPWLRLLPQVPVVGYELSCRFGPDGAWPDRVLLALDPDRMRIDQTSQSLSEWGMPDGLMRTWLEDSQHAQQFLIGAEASPDGVDNRAYLGFGPAEHPLQPGLAMRGYKWREGRQRVSDYWRMPVSVQQLASQGAMATGLPQQADAVWRILMQVLQTALVHGQGLEHMEWWAVTEAETARGSVCLRLYETGLCVADVAPALKRLASLWPSCAIRCDSTLDNMGPRALGWLAAGIDGAGLPFMTIYCEAERLDVRSLLEVSGVVYA
jgi:hypothetical protein